MPIASVAAGVGNAFGWVGLRGEVFVVQGRLSVLAGTGVVPIGHGACCNRLPVPVAGSVRYYVGRQQHRVFLDASWSVLHIESADAFADPYWGPITNFSYGPGLSLGYSFMSTTGLTVTVGAGLGRESYGVTPVAQLGIGWTWWRHHPS